jgi:hypothetical protein
MKSSAELLAQQQLDAYNNRDVDAFALCYADDIELMHQHSGEVFCSGIDALRQRYGAMFAATPNLHCTLVSRMVCGNFAIDEEHVRGMAAANEDGSEDIIHAIAIYEVQDNRIRRAWFMREVLAGGVQ